MQREGFVLDFCPTFRILPFVMSGKNLRSPFQNNTPCCFVHCVRIPVYILAKNKKHPPKRMLLIFWRRERDSNPRVLAHKLISRNTMNVTIRPSASLIFEKSADFSAFLPHICQIFRKSDRKVIENEVWSALKNFLLLTELTFKRSRDIISLSKSKPFLLCRKKMIDKSLVKLL